MYMSKGLNFTEELKASIQTSPKPCFTNLNLNSSPDASPNQAKLSKYCKFQNDLCKLNSSLTGSSTDLSGHQLSTNSSAGRLSCCNSSPVASQERAELIAYSKQGIQSPESTSDALPGNLPNQQIGDQGYIFGSHYTSERPSLLSKVSKDALLLLDSCNYSDPTIESKLLPPDLLSGDDESSPKNAREEEMAFHMFRSDNTSNNSFSKVMPAEGHSCSTVDQDEGNTSASSSSGAYPLSGKKMQVSEFQALDDEHDTSNYLTDKVTSSPTNKYTSIFSECLFAQKDASEEDSTAQNEQEASEQLPSIFSQLSMHQLHTSHNKLDLHFIDSLKCNQKTEVTQNQIIQSEQNQVAAADDVQNDREIKDDESNKTLQNPNGFAFPDGGWECSKCQNYNFKGRKQCHRCKKPKTVKDTTGRPEHMFRADEEKAALKTLKNKQKRLNKAKKLKEAKALLDQQTVLASENPEYKELSLNELSQQLKKMTKERAGDWACQRCGNHNFSFRYVCNKCQLTLEENDEILMQKQNIQPPAGAPAFSPQSTQSAAFIPAQMPDQSPQMVINQHHTFNTNFNYTPYQVACDQQNMMVQGQQPFQGTQMADAQLQQQSQYPCYPAMQQLPQWTPQPVMQWCPQ